ncbi:MAG: PIN domain-containing protein [Chloroflexi bacterium]|nr:PIN domain-containing protein [Chloroflexota bacterium]
MTARFDGLCFIDTNIWLYAFILQQDKEKHAVATRLIETQSDVIISTQVLNELTVNLLKKTYLGEAEIQKLVRSFYARYSIIAFDESILLEASELRTRYQLSFWDSLIVASALYVGADYLLTEDMQHNQVIGGELQIVSPFVLN